MQRPRRKPKRASDVSEIVYHSTSEDEKDDGQPAEESDSEDGDEAKAGPSAAKAAPAAPAGEKKKTRRKPRGKKGKVFLEDKVSSRFSGCRDSVRSDSESEEDSRVHMEAP